jgi:hypothetical protein
MDASLSSDVSLGARHARGFLDLADPDASALDTFETALRAAARSRAGRAALRGLENWTRTQLGLLGVTTEKALESDDVLDLLAAVRLVAMKAPLQSRRGSPRRFHHRLPALLDGLEADFVPELLKEIRRRTAADAGWARQIADSRRAVTKLHAAAEAVRGELVASLPPDVADDPQLPEILRDSQEEAAAGAIAVFVVVLVAVVTAWWIAGEDPAKND